MRARRYIRLSSPKAWLRAFVLLVLLIFGQTCRGYSLLTHEQIVDMAWKDEIQPLLLARFPAVTESQLRRAHAYAYGGCLIQDIGYYPFGNEFFSDLTHYVRTGDFVTNLIEESADLEQYAFALGALAHYCSDNTGHPLINRAVALGFPKLRAKYGDKVTFAQDHRSHIRTEFGFDMAQVAKNRYTSDRYHDFIGFEVSKPLLERAFARTYGLSLEDGLGPVDLAVGTFRRAVSRFIPQLTHVALVEKRSELVKDIPNFTKQKFLYNLSRAQYEKEWGKDYRRPSPGARLLALLLHLVPKVGPLKTLHFKIPTPETEDIYFKSVNKTMDSYRGLLRELRHYRLDLPNSDCDTGAKTLAGEYVLADQAYARLLDEHSKRDFRQMSPELRADILGFFAHAPPLPRRSKDKTA